MEDSSALSAHRSLGLGSRFPPGLWMKRKCILNKNKWWWASAILVVVFSESIMSYRSDGAFSDAGQVKLLLCFILFCLLCIWFRRAVNDKGGCFKYFLFFSNQTTYSICNAKALMHFQQHKYTTPFTPFKDQLQQCIQTYSLPKIWALVFIFFFFSTSVRGNFLFISANGALQRSWMASGRSSTAFSHGSMSGRGEPGFTARWWRH